MSLWIAIDGNGDIFLYKARPNFDSQDDTWMVSEGDVVEFVGNIDQLHASERLFEIGDMGPWA